MFYHSRLNMRLKTVDQRVPNHIMSQRSRSEQESTAGVQVHNFKVPMLQEAPKLECI